MASKLKEAANLSIAVVMISDDDGQYLLRGIGAHSAASNASSHIDPDPLYQHFQNSVFTVMHPTTWAQVHTYPNLIAPQQTIGVPAEVCAQPARFHTTRTKTPSFAVLVVSHKSALPEVPPAELFESTHI
jgi:hypothetical protein